HVDSYAAAATMKTFAVFVCAAALLAVAALRILPAQSRAASQSNKALVDDLVAANRVLAHEIAVLDAYGHVSVRDSRNPNHYFLSRAISAGMVSASDII